MDAGAQSDLGPAIGVPDESVSGRGEVPCGVSLQQGLLR